MRPPIDEIRNVLRQILPEYWPISEEGAHPGQALYKACDFDGNIYLITPPSAWKFTEAHGNRTYYRPKPRKVMSWQDAKRAAGSSLEPQISNSPHMLRF